MAYNSNLIRLLYLLTFAVQLAVVWGVWRRRLQREVRWFTIFLLSAVLESLCVYPLYEVASRGSIAIRNRYVGVAWGFESLGQILVLCFVVEIVRNSLLEYPGAHRLISRILVVAGALFLVVSLATAPVAHAEYPGTRLVNVIIRSVRLFEVGLIVAFFVLARFLALHLKNYSFGILLGFGLYAASGLAESALVAEYGSSVAFRAMLVDSVCNIGMYLIWLYYILKRDPGAPTASAEMGPDDLDAWKKTLDGMNRKGTSMV